MPERTTIESLLADSPGLCRASALPSLENDDIAPDCEGFWEPQRQDEHIDRSPSIAGREVVQIPQPKDEGVEASTEIPNRWSHRYLTGYLTELSGKGQTASYTAAASLIWQAQAKGEAVCWVTPKTHSFYPPDVAALGVDLRSLLVVRLKNSKHLGVDLARASETMLRSGAFGMIVVDLGKHRLPSDSWMGRVGRLAKQHRCVALYLTTKDKEEASLGSVIAVRAQTHVRQARGQLSYELQFLKDKRHGPDWATEVSANGPRGLCLSR